jgi:hypothetical protein
VLREENEDVAQIYMLVRGQYVTRHNGRYDVVVDVSIPAIKDAMDAFGIEDQRGTLLKVRRLFHHFLEDQNEN